MSITSPRQGVVLRRIATELAGPTPRSATGPARRSRTKGRVPDLRARGAKPEGVPWAIALEAPDLERRTAMGVVELGDAAIATSGDYRQGIEIGGLRISHAMDPRAGRPLRGALACVTVIAPVCADADAYATALMVLGEEAGQERARCLGLDALFVSRCGDGLRASGTGVFDLMRIGLERPGRHGRTSARGPSR